MPSMFTPAERRLAEAISHLTFINPFMPGRAEAERAVLGSQYVASDEAWNFAAAQGRERPNEVRLRHKIAGQVEQWNRYIRSRGELTADEGYDPLTAMPPYCPLHLAPIKREH